MLKLLKNYPNWPFVLLIGYLIINIFLIVQTMLIPEMSGKIPWFAIVWTFCLSIYLWKVFIKDLPKSGMLSLGLLISGIVFLYGMLKLLPEGGGASRLLKMFLAFSGGVILLPLSHVIAQRYQIKYQKVKSLSPSVSNSPGLHLTKVQILLLKIAIAVLIFSVFITPVFLRSDIIGWDTPTHLLRARLVDSHGISVHAQNNGGYQVTFPILAATLHRITGLNYFDLIRLLPSLMMVLISFTSGYFAYTIYKNLLFALSTVLFTCAWVLSPWMISNLFDNITVTFFGILFIICLAKSYGKNIWLFEMFQVLFLVLTGISHLTLSSIFFITIFHVNIMELYDSYFKGEQKDLAKHLWKAIRVPLVSGLIVFFIWFPGLMDFINSLGFGLRTHAELGEGRDPSFSWIIKRYNLAVNFPWILLGYIYIAWNNIYRENNRSLRVVFAWSTICIIFGIVLQPISFLNSRFLIMSPIFIVVPLGFYQILSKDFLSLNALNFKIFATRILIIISMGFLLAVNIILNTSLLITIPGIQIAGYSKIDYVNKYINTYDASAPYVFIVEDIGSSAETYSDLWLRIIKAKIADKGLLNTYIYFGTLDYLLEGKQTPLEENGLPELNYEIAFSNSSQRWFDILNKNKVFEQTKMTIFILEEYNPDIYHDYEYLPVVDKIGPGVLVINLPDDRVYQTSIGESNP